MSIEIPDNNLEEVKNIEEEENAAEMSPEEMRHIEEAESAIEMSPEDFQLMIDEIPVFKEMLKEWEGELTDLEKDPNVNAKEIETLKIDIGNLRYQISEREELIG